VLVLVLFSLFVASYGAAVECEGCHFLVGTIETWVAQNNTETQIANKLEAFCKILGDSDQNVCKGIIEAGVPQIIAMIEAKQTPTQICISLKYCTSLKVKATPVECEGCHFLVGTIETWVAQNNTETQIATKLETLCKVLGEGDQGVCKSVIDGGVPQIIAMIEAKQTPTQICVSLNWCTASTSAKFSLIKFKATPVECEGCHFLVGTIETWVAQNNTETQIATKLETLCKVLGEGDQGVCKSVIDGGVPQIIAMIEAKQTPTQICVSLNWCTASMRQRIIHPVTQASPISASPVECEACHVIVRAVDAWLAQNRSKEQISKDLAYFCTFLLHESKASCDAIASTDIDLLVEWIESNETPEEACGPKQLKQCDALSAPSTFVTQSSILKKFKLL